MSTTAYETMTLLGQCALSGTVYGVNPYQNVSFIPIYKTAITKALQKLYTEFNLKEDVLAFPSQRGGAFSLDAHTVIKPILAEYSNGVGISINDLNDPHSAMLMQHNLMQLTVDSNVPSGYLSYQAYHASLDLLAGYVAPSMGTTKYTDVPILLPVYLHNAFFALVSYYMLNTLTTSTDWSGAAGEMYREYKRNVELVKNSMLLRTQEESTNLVRRDLGWL